MTRDFLQALRERVLVADGAMGTRLQALTGKVDACLDGLNLDPVLQETVSSVHRSYVQAGADLVLTNTYGANGLKLARHGLEKRVHDINLAGARLAREACGPERFVGGSVGPLEIAGSEEDYTEDDLRALFREQIRGLVDGGVDFLALETFQDLAEATAALKEAALVSIPVSFAVGGVTRGRTGTGADAREFILAAERLGAHVAGANCRGPWDILETLHLLAQVTSLPLLAKPNAGNPEIDRGRIVYNVEPTQFQEYARRFVEEGAAIVGGCCGTDARHVTSLRRAVETLVPPRPRTVSRVRVLSREAAPPSPDLEPSPNAVDEVFRTVPFITSVEMRPSREESLASYLEAGRLLAREGVHLFDVPDNAGARVNIDPMVAASLLQSATAIPTLMHLSTSHRNLVATQSYLLGAWHLGIQGVLGVTGDHPNIGDHDKYAQRVVDVKSSVNLLRMIRGLNEGHLVNQAPCLRTNFLVGAGFNPGRGLGAQVRWLERKLEAGARFLYTQPVFRIDEVDAMLEATSHLDVPILVGLMPLTSRRNAEFFAAGKIPGIVVPPEILERFQELEDPEAARELGLDLARRLACEVRSRARLRGLYLIPPFGRERYRMVCDILAAARAAAPGS